MSQKFSLFFLTKLKKTETKNNFVLSCSFDPIKIRTRLAPQNVHKNLSFVKDTNVVCQNMTRKCCKIVQKPICALHFRYVFKISERIPSLVHFLVTNDLSPVDLVPADSSKT